ncbi:MAG TPA: glycine--tRNA ligase subunit beta [Candidatus Elarobacter sp.]
MAELLLELFSEEIPARMQAAAAEQLRAAVTARLAEERLEFTRAEAYATPRRLALVVDGLPARQPDVLEERKGPHVGAPQRALEGFMTSAGVTTLEGMGTRIVGGAEYYYLSRSIPGRATGDVVADIVTATIASFAWPKSMRWGSEPMRWVRPLQNVLCLFDGAVAGVTLPSHGLRANDTTYGHRFMAPQPVAVSSFDDYARKLRAAYVVLDPRERKELIASGVAALAAAEGLSVPADPALLDEVAGLVEWPVPLLGAIDAAFMELPREVLTTTMRANQKYFPLETRDGALAPRFAVVANLDAPDGGAAIVAGNERVLRPRFSDARFFWDQDRKTPLEARVPRLDALVFQAKLGTVGDKVRRLERLAPALAAWVPGAPDALAARAAHLCKADLVTGMVGEFPELQGKIGRYYALAEGEDAAVADAIADHYAPLGPNDRAPSAPVSIAAALGDKVDTLAGFFGAGEKPTGSKDPFGLRRAALGAIRIIVENRLRLPLREAFSRAHALYAEQRPCFGTAASENALADELLEFFADRLKVYLRERGVRHDLIAAVFSLGDEDDLVRLLARVDALAAFLGSQDGANLLTAYKRASNIVRREESKDKTRYDGAPEAALLVQPEETALAAELARATGEIRDAAAREDFAGAMAALARLRPFVDVFFDTVTVNADDTAVRANRLRLLSGIRSALGAVADFSKIEG